MRTTKDTQPEKPKSVKRKQASLLLAMADTTWRMIAPSAIFVIIGLYGDIHLHTKPWLTLISVVIGLGISVILIRSLLSEHS